MIQKGKWCKPKKLLPCIEHFLYKQTVNINTYIRTAIAWQAFRSSALLTKALMTAQELVDLIADQPIPIDAEGIRLFPGYRDV